MHFSLDVGWLSAFLLAMTRATAWLFVAPPFSTSGIPLKVRLGFGMALGLFIAPHFQATTTMNNSFEFIGAILYQALIGLAMGFGVLLLISAVQAAGALIDFSAGFSSAAAYDPFSNASSTPIARFYQMLAVALLFASQGHLVILRGFLMSFDHGPTTGSTSLEQIGKILAFDMGTFFAAALQMAIPMLAALFLAEIALGLVARATPQLNLLPLSFGVKMGATLLLCGVAIKILPASLYQLVQQASDTMIAIGR